MAGRRFGHAAARLRAWQPAGIALLSFSVSPMGLATYVFSGRFAGIAGPLCARAREGIGNLAEIERGELGQATHHDPPALASLLIPCSADDRHEPRLPRHAGYVSNLPATLLEVRGGR